MGHQKGAAVVRYRRLTYLYGVSGLVKGRIPATT